MTAAAGVVSRRLEWGCGLLLLACALVPRLAWIAAVPTAPVSDFRNLLDFAIAVRDGAPPGGWWAHFNPGLPFTLALVLRAVGGDAAAVARVATAVWTSLPALVPWLLWRGVVALPLRVVAGLLLAWWPGQIVFAGVVAQDNWVIVPVVASAALAVRVLRARGGGAPIAAAALYAVSVWFRQEFLVACAPLAIAGAGLAGAGRRRRLGLLLASAVVLLGLVAAQRGRATGRPALGTDRGGLAVLGSYVPGARGAWFFPGPFIASVDPSLLDDGDAMSSAAYRLALREALRRPGFHVVRIGSDLMMRLTTTDALYWAIDAEGAAAEDVRRRVVVLERVANLAVRASLWIVHSLFLAALLVGWRRRSAPILVLSAAVALKVAVHAVTVMLSRFFLPVVALEMLVITLAIDETGGEGRRRRAAIDVCLGALAAGVLMLAAPSLSRWVTGHDEDMRGARFFLTDSRDRPALDCSVVAGGVDLTMRGTHVDHFATARLHFRGSRQAPGETARLDCRPMAGGVPPLQLFDPLPDAGHPGRVVARLLLDGREAQHRDLAGEPGEGWFDVTTTPARLITLELTATTGEPGWHQVVIGIRLAR